MRTYIPNVRTTASAALVWSIGLGIALVANSALATLPPGLNMWTTNEFLFTENFGYGDPSGSMLVSNFHGWYSQGPSDTGLGLVQFQTTAVPGFSTTGHAVHPQNGSDPYGFAGKFFTHGVTNEIVVLEFSVRTGSVLGSPVYPDYVALAYDMVPNGTDAGRVNYHDDGTSPPAVAVYSGTTNIVPQTGQSGQRAVANPFVYQTDTTYGIRYFFDLNQLQSFLQVRTYDEGSSTWGAYVDLDSSWVAQNVSDASPSINYLNGVGLLLSEGLIANTDILISDISVYTLTGAPEPSTVLLGGLGAALVCAWRRRKKLA